MDPRDEAHVGRPLEETVRIEGGRVLATLVRLTGDLDLAQDAVQDALVVALDRWPRDGVPLNPGAWLTTVARRQALDRIRRESKRTDKELAAIHVLDTTAGPADDDSEIADDVLRLLFTCCHPALAPEARVALALRTLCGLTTTEIAAAFLVPEPTMGQRISRAKKKIAGAAIPFRVPPAHELPARLGDVLTTIYVVYTAGHHPTTGPLDARVDLATEAIRLARLVVSLMPDEPEAAGLLALLLATNARRSTRTAPSGDLVLLDAQDRSLWDHAAIAEATRLVQLTLRRRQPGPFQIKAAIATLHGLAPTFAATDWRQITLLYELLERHEPTPVVRVNRAVAAAHAQGPEAGLALLDALAPADLEQLQRWHLYWSTKAELLRRTGDVIGAETAFRSALECPVNDTDRSFLEGRIRELEARRHRPIT